MVSKIENNFKENEMLEYDVNIQLAENDSIPDEEYESSYQTSYDEKRKLLEKTKIVKQTWSIREIYQKIESGSLILDPVYQRHDIWKTDKQTAFIESLFMGIIVPPIYVVEIPVDDMLNPNKYEVVDGKQRLTAIMQFVGNNLALKEKALEYFTDWFSNKKFLELKSDYSELINQMLSSVLDIYVITANSPEFTKYDIFSRLNKGSEPLKVNEIRKAIYRSDVLMLIEEFVQKNIETHEYKEIFSTNDINRYEDFGRFYRSIAYYIRTNIENQKVEGYNSRPREMINDVLYNLQFKETDIKRSTLNSILEQTMKLMKEFSDNREYMIDCCIKYAVDYTEKFYKKLDAIKTDEEIKDTLKKSPSTTSNVDKRIKLVDDIINDRK